MEEPIITESQIRQVVDSVVSAALDGDVKAATLIFNHFIPKPKPRQLVTPYKNLDDVRNAYHLGILTSEEVISAIQAMELLNGADVLKDDLLWDDNMISYVKSIQKT